MQTIKLDTIDFNILNILQKNGRISNVELAKEVGLSAPPCLRRVKALEKAGYIESYHAKVNSVKLGYSVTIFAFVSLKSQQETDLNMFSDYLEKWEMVRESHMLAGDVDFILKIVAKDWESYNKFLVNELMNAHNVANVRSALGIKTNKYEAGVPINK